MLTYQYDTVENCIMEIQPLIVAHWEEITTHKDVKILDPDYEKYIILERAGQLRIFTARDNGKLIGYFISIIVPHLHYQTCITALNDILYIAPEYRGGTAAYRLFKGAIKDLKENTKTDVVIVHMKIKHPFRELLAKLGFAQTEENWEMTI